MASAPAYNASAQDNAASAPPLKALPNVASAAMLSPAGVKSPLLQSALKVGVPGAAAAAAQSASFMWISTAAAFQYRSGRSMRDAFRILYAQGGFLRFYAGVVPTMMHVALCRFGDTTANVFVLQHAPDSVAPNIAAKTALASVAAATWRCLLLPLETLRSNLQVKGNTPGLSSLTRRIRLSGTFNALYSGATASFTAGLLGHFPFFCTVNYLSSNVSPLPHDASVAQKLQRNGGIGFLAAMCSDVVTNGFKIVATNKQTSSIPVTYYETAQKIIKTDGALALLTRGLKTRLIGNGIQGATFVLLWKEIEQRRSITHTISPE